MLAKNKLEIILTQNMNKPKLLLSVFIGLCITAFSQKTTQPVFKPEGKAIVRVFANYSSNLGGNEQVKSFDAMQIKRAYLGYKSTLSKELGVKITMDVGNHSGKYDAYLKIAELNYHKDKFSAHIGMIATKQFKVQEGFWGYRYLQKSFQDEYKYNGSADLGLSIDYKINKLISIDAIIQNGEGYKHVDPTGTYRAGFGATMKYKPLIFRAYYDISSKPDINRQNIATLIGYQLKDKFKIAAEYNFQINNHFVKDHKMYGYSVYTTFFVNKKLNFFARYDNSRSNIIDDSSSRLDPQPWNANQDESLALVGFEYKMLKNVKISTNYRRALSAVKDAEGVNWFFLNLEFKL